MNEFQDKDDALKRAWYDIDVELRNVHPVDKVDAYRAIEKEAGQAATRQAETNDREGVPERPQDIEWGAADRALDGGR